MAGLVKAVGRFGGASPCAIVTARRLRFGFYPTPAPALFAVASLFGCSAVHITGQCRMVDEVPS